MSQSLLNGLVHEGKCAAIDRCHSAGHLMPRTFLHVKIGMPGQQLFQVALCEILPLSCGYQATIGGASKRCDLLIHIWQAWAC